MFDLPTYLSAVSTIDTSGFLFAGLAVGSVALVATYSLAHGHGYEEGHMRGYGSGVNDGLGLADTEASYLDGFNDGLDASDERGAYLDGFEDGIEAEGAE